jgi:hypothetical protein
MTGIMIVFSIVDNYDYKSEWLTADFVIFTSIITAIIYSLKIAFLSLTLLLNKIKKIREVLILRILSWFLFPFGFMTIVFFHEIGYDIKYDESEFGYSFIYILIMNILFIIGLIWGFLSFSNYLKTNSAIGGENTANY